MKEQIDRGGSLLFLPCKGCFASSSSGCERIIGRLLRQLTQRLTRREGCILRCIVLMNASKCRLRPLP